MTHHFPSRHGSVRAATVGHLFLKDSISRCVWGTVRLPVASCRNQALGRAFAKLPDRCCKVLQQAGLITTLGFNLIVAEPQLLPPLCVVGRKMFGFNDPDFWISITLGFTLQTANKRIRKASEFRSCAAVDKVVAQESKTLSAARPEVVGAWAIHVAINSTQVVLVSWRIASSSSRALAKHASVKSSKAMKAMSCTLWAPKSWCTCKFKANTNPKSLGTPSKPLSETICTKTFTAPEPAAMWTIAEGGIPAGYWFPCAIRKPLISCATSRAAAAMTGVYHEWKPSNWGTWSGKILQDSRLCHLIGFTLQPATHRPSQSPSLLKLQIQEAPKGSKGNKTLLPDSTVSDSTKWDN